MRVRQLEIDAASNPAVAFPAILPLTVSNVVTVDRDPVGGVPISGLFITQRVSLSIGPTRGRPVINCRPMSFSQLSWTSDVSGQNAIGTNTLS